MRFRGLSGGFGDVSQTQKGDPRMQIAFE